MEKTLNITGVVEQLRQLIAAGGVEDALGLVASLLGRMQEENSRTALRLLKLLRDKYGRKSEKLGAEQLSLLLGELREVIDPQAPVPVNLPPRRERKRKQARPHGRQQLPAELPREEVPLAVPAAERTCGNCGREKEVIGYERSEVLEFVPASFKVIAYLREKLACRPCGDGVVIAPAANKVIERGLPGSGMLAQVVVDKYQDHLPLYRQAQRYVRLGVKIARSTLSDWNGAAAGLLEPLWKANRELVLLSEVLQADGTHLKVLDDQHEANIKRGSLWCFVGDAERVHFEYAPTEGKAAPLAVLSEREGYVVADADTKLDSLFAAPDSRVTEVGCWMHGRRRFRDALDGGELRAAYPLDLIQKMYQVEREAKHKRAGPEEVLHLRQQLTKPLLEALWKWILDNGGQVRPTSPLGQAMGYAVRNRVALTRFLEDGRLPIDNGACERAIRGVAVGRRNYLFAGSDTGAERAAIAYSLLGSCTLARVNPWVYLKDVLEQLAGGWPQARILELLPLEWAEAHPEHRLSSMNDDDVDVVVPDQPEAQVQ